MRRKDRMVEKSLSFLSGDGMSLIPLNKKYAQNYRVSRIKLDPIDITEEMAHDVFEKILNGTQAIVLGNHLVMCSCITSIDPLPLIKPPEKYPQTPELSPEEWERGRKKLEEIKSKFPTKKI
jgi:hypothetical protein